MDVNVKPYHWWKHDYTQRNSIAARRFDHKYGINTGYGIYCKLLEILLHSGGCIKEADIDLYSDELGFEEGELNNCLAFASEYGIFYQSEDGFRSSFIDEVINYGIDLSKKRSQAAKGVDKVSQSTNPSETGLVEKPAKKTKEKPVQDAEETEDIGKVKTAIQVMLSHAEKTSGVLPGNKKSTLTNTEIDSLIDRFGIDLLLGMVDVFYLWKLTSRKVIKSDYLSLLQDWVQEKAIKQLNGNGNCKQSSKPTSDIDVSKYKM